MPVPNPNPADMTLSDAQNELGNRVYEAAMLLERLEDAGRINGNGHHVARKIAVYAVDLLTERWLGDKPQVAQGKEAGHAPPQAKPH